MRGWHVTGAWEKDININLRPADGDGKIREAVGRGCNTVKTILNRREVGEKVIQNRETQR